MARGKKQAAAPMAAEVSSPVSGPLQGTMSAIADGQLAPVAKAEQGNMEQRSGALLATTVFEHATDKAGDRASWARSLWTGTAEFRAGFRRMMDAHMASLKAESTLAELADEAKTRARINSARTLIGQFATIAKVAASHAMPEACNKESFRGIYAAAVGMNGAAQGRKPDALLDALCKAYQRAIKVRTEGDKELSPEDVKVAAVVADVLRTLGGNPDGDDKAAK